MSDLIRGVLLNFFSMVSFIHFSEVAVRQLRRVRFNKLAFLLPIALILAGWCSIFLGIKLDDQIFDLRWVPVSIAAMYFPGSYSIAFVAAGIGLFRYFDGMDPPAIKGFAAMVAIGLCFVPASKWIAKWKIHRLWRAVVLITLATSINVATIIMLKSMDLDLYLRHILPVQYPLAVIFWIFTVVLAHESEVAYKYRSSLMDAAYKDPLTGLNNRRHFQGYTKKLQAEKIPSVSVSYIDVDHFKSINDTYGHDFGDTVIQTIGMVIQREIRQTDYVARIGGEEFFIVLHEASSDQAKEVLERVRKMVEKLSFHEQQSCQVTISVGVSHFGDYLTPALIKEADDALYVAKNGGRNRVVISSDAAE